MGAGEELLVLEFLKDRGFADAYGALRRELASQAALPESDSAPLALVHTLEGSSGGREGSSSRELVLSLAADGDPKAYLQEFGKLATWVGSGALDVYRPELQRLLYPLFVHAYLELVQRGASQQASELLSTHRRQLVDMAGKGASIRAQELQELQGIAVPQHLEINGFALAARSNRQLLRLSSFSFELVMRFLQSAKLLLMLGIVNDRLQFQVYEGSPQFQEAAASAEEEQSLFAGGVRAADAPVPANLQPLLGLLKGNLEDLYAATLTAADEPKGAAAGDKDGGKEGTKEGPEKEGSGAKEGEGGQPLTKRAKIAKEKAAAAARSRRKEVEDSRIEAEIPLLPFSEAVREAAFADFAARAEVGPNELPSCCFLTFVNTRRSLCSMAFSGDAAHVAGGFSDSSLRIYDLPELAKQRKAHRQKLLQRQRKRERDAAQPKQERDKERDKEKDKEKERERTEEEERELLAADEPSELQDALEDALTANTVTTLRGHSAPVYALDYSLDQRFLFSASGDGTLRLWSSELQEGLVVYRGHVTPIWDVAASPLGHYFASAGSDRTARLWSTEHVHALRMFVGHQADVDVVRWHPNGHCIATGSSDRSVRLWDLRSGASARILSGHTTPISSLAFHPDGKTLACGTSDGRIAVYDLGSGARSAVLQGHEGPVWSLAYSQGSGALLASGGADATVRLWSAPRHAASMLALVDEQRAAAAAPGAAGAGAAASTGGLSSSTGSQQVSPHQLLRTYRTRATPVVAAAFTRRNLLLAGGPLSLQPPAQ